MSSCGQYDHRFFVADIALVPSEGKFVLIALCTACGNVLTHEQVIAQPHASLELNSIQRKKLERG